MELSKYSIFLSINEGKTDSVINYFQNSNIDINLSLNNFNWTSLHTAAYRGNMKLVEFLLKRGANMNIPNASGLTALNLAESKQLWKIVDLMQNFDKFP